MNKASEELFIKYLKNKVKFYKEMADIGLDYDDFDRGRIVATEEILSHFLLLVKTENAALAGEKPNNPYDAAEMEGLT